MDEIKVDNRQLPYRLRFSVGYWKFLITVDDKGGVEVVRTNSQSERALKYTDLVSSEEAAAFKSGEWCRGCGDLGDLDPASNFKWCRRCSEGNLLW